MPIYKKINKDFFKKWSGDMAYIVGFFAADGYITVNKRGGQFWSIQITDKKLLYSFKKKLESEHKITVKRVKGKNLAYRLQIGSIEMCNDLRALGFKERKTRVLVIPDIPKMYFRDFIRGYFDGDGNVWVGFVHKNRPKASKVIQTVFTSGSAGFLRDLSLKLADFGIKKGVYREVKQNYGRLTYSIDSSFKLFNFMYNGHKSDLFLNRKKLVFEKFFNDRKLRL